MNSTRNALIAVILVVLIGAAAGLFWLIRATPANLPARPGPSQQPVVPAHVPAPAIVPSGPAAPVVPVSPAPPVTSAQVTAPMVTAPSVPPPKVPATEETAGTSAKPEWALVDERTFDGRLAWKTLHPYYVLQSDRMGEEAQQSGTEWDLGYGNPPVSVQYHPANEIALAGGYGADAWIRLARQTPHAVRWALTFAGAGSDIKLDDDGVVISCEGDETATPLTGQPLHTLILTRSGAELSLQVDGGPAHVQKLAPDDRTPLRVVAQRVPVLLRTTKLYFALGEKLIPAPPPPPEPPAAKWSRVVDEPFATAKSLELFAANPVPGVLSWKEDDQAFLLDSTDDALVPDVQAYLLLHRSLPGDVRISFRARNPDSNRRPFFGVLLGLKGTLKKEDAYYVEWSGGQVQIKRHNVRVAGLRTALPEADGAAWYQFRIEKTAGKITLFTNDKAVLTWTDPHPLTDADHDLFSFYVYHQQLEVDDLKVDRNTLDTIHPRADDPATEENFIRGERGGEGAKAVPDEF